MKIGPAISYICLDSHIDANKDKCDYTIAPPGPNFSKVRKPLHWVEKIDLGNFCNLYCEDIQSLNIEY